MGCGDRACELRPIAGALLVGNEDDRHISAFDFTTGTFLGQLRDSSGDPLANTGLWGLRVGNGGNGGDPGKLYSRRGSMAKQTGCSGNISAVLVPEPGTLLLVALGCVMLLRARRDSLGWIPD